MREVLDSLDAQILAEAYSSTLQPEALTAATVCLTDCNALSVINYFRQLHAGRSAGQHFGDTADSEDGLLARGEHRLLWLQILLCAFAAYGCPDASLSDDAAASLAAYFRSGSWSADMKIASADWAMATCDTLVDYLEGAGT